MKIFTTFAKRLHLTVVRGFVSHPSQSYRGWRRRRRFEKILEQSALAMPRYFCAPDSPGEVHTLTTHRHIYMYLAAIKSFLRFYNQVGVVVHDDGKLTPEDKQILSEHISGIRIIDKKSGDEAMSDILKAYPNCRRYRDESLMAKQILDYYLLSHAKKIISLDSDTLCLSRPDALIDWIEGDGDSALTFYENAPVFQKEYLTEMNCSYPPHVCIGLVCMTREWMDIAFIENIVSKLKSFSWYTAQNLYPILLQEKLKGKEPAFLDMQAYQSSGSFEDGAVCRHYWSSSIRFLDIYEKDVSTQMLIMRAGEVSVS